MDDLDTFQQPESAHHLDYDDVLEHVVGDDHELLYLDTWLREAFSGKEKEAESL